MKMMDRKKISELRLLLLSDAGSEQDRSDQEYEFYPYFGELLALADASLEIRLEYRRFADAGENLVDRYQFCKRVVDTMKKLDVLEKESQQVQEIAPLRPGG